MSQPSTLQLAIDADHVVLLEATIRQIASRYCSRNADQALCVAWEAALVAARDRETARLGTRKRFV